MTRLYLVNEIKATTAARRPRAQTISAELSLDFGA
jgi:hypothetical protein